MFLCVPKLALYPSLTVTLPRWAIDRLSVDLGGKLVFTCLFQSAHKSMPFEKGLEHKGPHPDTKSLMDTVECRTEFPGKQNVVYRELDNR